MAIAVLTLVAGKSNQVFFTLVSCVVNASYCIVHDLLFHLTKAMHLNLNFYVHLQLLSRNKL